MLCLTSTVLAKYQCRNVHQERITLFEELYIYRRMLVLVACDDDSDMDVKGRGETHVMTLPSWRCREHCLGVLHERNVELCL
jgi:hypothetical protein